MSAISSNTLFHFTNQNNLLGILKDAFYPKYSIETYYKNNKKTLNVGIPMVCFCDIPLAQVKEHMKAYGQYGIGMTIKWAKKNRLNPVLYLEKHSLLTTEVHSVLQSNYDELKELSSKKIWDLKASDDRESLLKIFMRTKPFEGDYNRNNKIESKKFYDEREWRYVPNIAMLENAELLLNKKAIKKTTLTMKNKLLKDFKLSFEPDDIKYLIISKENERNKFINEIKKNKSRYTGDKILLLISKIISAEQILTDI